jgi:hypothetical protein
MMCDVALGIFVVTLIHQIAVSPAQTQLPDIDSSLLVLMGISHGGYLGKKLVTFGTPTLYPPVPAHAVPGDQVTGRAASLGQGPGGSQLLLDGAQVGFDSWSDTAVVFTIEQNDPVGNLPWPAQKVVNISVLVSGQGSNNVPLTIAPDPAGHPAPAGHPGLAVDPH